MTKVRIKKKPSQHSEVPQNDALGEDVLKKGGWLKGAVNPAHKGYCTPMSKSTCTGHRRAFALTMKKHHGFHKKGQGGSLMYPFQMDMGGILKTDTQFPDMDGNMYEDGGEIAQQFEKWYKQNYKKGGKKLDTQNLIGNITNPAYMKKGGDVFAGKPNADLNPTTNHSVADYNPYVYFKDKKWYITSNPEDETITKTMKPIDRDAANIEAEKGEMFVKPGLTGLYKIGGDTHKQGGTPLYAEGGSFIFSNDPKLAINKKSKETFGFKDGGSTAPSKNTPAKILGREVKPEDYNTMMDIVQDPKRDKIARTTAMLMLEKMQQKIGQVAYLQEAKKNEKIPDFAQGTAPVKQPQFEDIDERMSEYAYGGMYPDGGPTNPVGLSVIGDFLNNQVNSYNAQAVPFAGRQVPQWGDFPDRDGVWTGDNRKSRNPQTGALSNNWNAMTDFKSAREYASAVGYPGKDMAPLAIQKWVGMAYPDLVAQYHNNPPTGYGQPNAGTPYDGKMGVRWNAIGKAVQQTNGLPLKYAQTPGLQQVDVNRDTTVNPPLGTPQGVNAQAPVGNMPYDIKGKLTDAQMAHLGFMGLQAMNINRYYPKREQVNLPEVRLDQVNAQPYLNQINNQSYASTQLAALNPRTSPLMDTNIRGQAIDAKNQAIGNVANQNVQIGNQQNLTNLQQRSQQVMANSQFDNTYYNQVQSVNENFDREKRFAGNQFYSTLNQYKSQDDQLAWALASVNKYGIRRVTDPKTGQVFNQPVPLYEATQNGIRYNADVANSAMATNANRLNTPMEYRQFIHELMQEPGMTMRDARMIISRIAGKTGQYGQGPTFMQNPYGNY